MRVEVTRELSAKGIPRHQQEAAIGAFVDCLNLVVVVRADCPLPAPSARRLKVRGH